MNGRAGRLQDIQATNAALAARAKAAEDDDARVLARLLARLQKVENQLDRFRSQEFWDWVMQEIYEIIPAGGMTPAEILPELQTGTALAPGHRVKVLEMQGQFGALKEIYAERHHRHV